MHTRNISAAKKGFTLIELLVVIAIIGILASVILVSLNASRAKARDAKRLKDMQQIKLAIELFYSDNGYYPTCSGNIHCDTTGAFGGPLNELEVVPAYIASIENDPLNEWGQYGYYYGRGYIKTGATSFTSTGSDSDYILGMRLERGSLPAYTGWGNSNLNYLDSNRTN